MSIPQDLEAAIDGLLQKIPANALSAAREELSERYRSHERDAIDIFISKESHRHAYLASRLPATFSVVTKVLQEISGFHPKTMADLGAGPGTASLAAAYLFSGLESFNLYERDAGWMPVGKALMEALDADDSKQMTWHPCDLSSCATIARSDLVILSYAIGELSKEALDHAVIAAWQATEEFLVIIEPGTPHGFSRIMQARDLLIDKKAQLIAPCPHMGACPFSKDKERWCHFSLRLERTEWQMAAKKASLGYEDEKYCYLIFAKQPTMMTPCSRIIGHPGHHGGHMELELCTQEGIEKLVLSRRHGALYKQARKLHWGDLFEG